jgi:hypothetical protein
MGNLHMGGRLEHSSGIGPAEIRSVELDLRLTSRITGN